jgi:hypothetical protein
MASDDGRARKACCLVSEVLEEAGLDRKKARQIRKQVLEGVILLCRWQLERIREAEADDAQAPAPSARHARRVRVE